MKFTNAPSNPFYDDHGFTKRMESENGRWSIFLDSALGNTNIKAGITNEDLFVLDVCCSNDLTDIVLVYTIVKYWLEGFPESVSFDEIKKSWPVFSIKPVMRNPEWDSFIEYVVEQKRYESN